MLIKDWLESGKAETVVSSKAISAADTQLSLISTAQSPVIERLTELDLNTLTPIEAMNILYELKKMI